MSFVSKRLFINLNIGFCLGSTCLVLAENNTPQNNSHLGAGGAAVPSVTSTSYYDVPEYTYLPFTKDLEALRPLSLGEGIFLPKENHVEILSETLLGFCRSCQRDWSEASNKNEVVGQCKGLDSRAQNVDLVKSLNKQKGPCGLNQSLVRFSFTKLSVDKAKDENSGSCFCVDKDLLRAELEANFIYPNRYPPEYLNSYYKMSTERDIQDALKKKVATANEQQNLEELEKLKSLISTMPIHPRNAPERNYRKSLALSYLAHLEEAYKKKSDYSPELTNTVDFHANNSLSIVCGSVGIDCKDKTFDEAGLLEALEAANKKLPSKYDWELSEIKENTSLINMIKAWRAKDPLPLLQETGTRFASFYLKDSKEDVRATGALEAFVVDKSKVPSGDATNIIHGAQGVQTLDFDYQGSPLLDPNKNYIFRPVMSEETDANSANLQDSHVPIEILEHHSGNQWVRAGVHDTHKFYMDKGRFAQTFNGFSIANPLDQLVERTMPKRFDKKGAPEPPKVPARLALVPHVLEQFGKVKRDKDLQFYGEGWTWRSVMSASRLPDELKPKVFTSTRTAYSKDNNSPEGTSQGGPAAMEQEEIMKGKEVYHSGQAHLGTGKTPSDPITVAISPALNMQGVHQGDMLYDVGQDQYYIVNGQYTNDFGEEKRVDVWQGDRAGSEIRKDPLFTPGKTFQFVHFPAAIIPSDWRSAIK